MTYGKDEFDSSPSKTGMQRISVCENIQDGPIMNHVRRKSIDPSPGSGVMLGSINVGIPRLFDSFSDVFKGCLPTNPRPFALFLGKLSLEIIDGSRVCICSYTGRA